MIAKKIPATPPTGKRGDVAAAYGLTLEEFNAAWQEYGQCEGYDDSGREYATLHDWLTRDHSVAVDRTPWQKGDDLLE